MPAYRLEHQTAIPLEPQREMTFGVCKIPFTQTTMHALGEIARHMKGST